MSILGDVVNIGTGGLIPDITGEDAIAQAAALSAAGSQAAIDEQRRQFDITQEQMLPFLQAATGEGGALGQYMTDISGAPISPELQAFQFDPTKALESPALQFQQEMGEQALQRSLATNRQLGSGQRLLEAEQFGQGIAAQGIGDEFYRQSTMNQMLNNQLLQQHALEADRYNTRMNRLAGLIDVGAGTGTAMGQFGMQSASNIGNLMQTQANTQAGAVLGANQGINSLVGQGVGLAGVMAGMPTAGMAMGGGMQPTSVPSIGFQPTGLY